MCGKTSVMKELHCLLRNKDKLYDGQVDIEMDDGEFSEEYDGENSQESDTDMVKFFMTITPKDGLYKNARCIFKVYVDSHAYPAVPPEVKCLHKIYHPNIDMLDDDGEGSICVSLLSEDWLPEVGLDGCVNAVLFLFYNPQIDDALNPVCSDFSDWSEYEEKVYQALRGEVTDGFVFDQLIQVYANEKDATKDENTQGGKGDDHEITQKDQSQTVLNKDTSAENNQSQSFFQVSESGNEQLPVVMQEATYQSKFISFSCDENVQIDQSQHAIKRTYCYHFVDSIGESSKMNAKVHGDINLMKSTEIPSKSEFL